MTEHTPAPWRVHEHSDKRHREFAVISDTGNQHDDGAAKVAAVLGGKLEHVSTETARANAQLIASAPELLHALNRIIRGDAGSVEYAREVIGKVHGQN